MLQITYMQEFFNNIMKILLKMEHVVTNFNLLKLERDDNALPLYPPPSTCLSWSPNSQQLYLVPPCNYFTILFEVNDALSFFQRLTNTHHAWSWASYHF